MDYKKDKIIHFPPDFLKEKSVLYVADDMGMFRTEWMDLYKPEIAGLFREAGKKLIFLSDLIRALDPVLLQYLFPGLDFCFTEEDLYRRLVGLIGSCQYPGFIYKKSNVVYFHAITGATDGQAMEEIRTFISNLAGHPADSSEYSSGDIRFRKVPSNKEEALRKQEEREQVVLDSRAQAILDAWSQIEREYGITIEGLELLLGYKVKLSRLSITTSNRLFLTDFDNQEVKMDDLTKALYFFYLLHPEGASLKELHEHEDEILHIYSRITGRDDARRIRKSVQNLVDPFGNNLNVSLSRIKKAFKDVVGDRIARFYYVSGSYGEVRTVDLDRDLVIWEH